MSDPLFVVTILIVSTGLVLWVSTLPRFEGFFKRLPAVLFVYFTPMLLTTAGVLPETSPVYTWFSRYGLLVALFLLMVTADVPAILRLGPLALMTMLAGTLGIVIGGPIALMIFNPFLPDDAWMGLAALSGSWIGGTANMVAIQQMVGAPASVMSPAIVVDTVVGYGWAGVLMFVSGYQERFDRYTGAKTELLERLYARAAQDQSGPPVVTMPSLAWIVALGFAAASLGRWVGPKIPPVEFDGVAIVTSNTWAILLVVTVGLALSFTRLREIERGGGGIVGSYALYVLLASIGAQANLRAVLDAPAYLGAGVVWITIHVLILFGVARLLRAPLALVAVSSMANIGGPASAPVVAGVYHRALPPVGLLLAVAGYAVGIYAGWLTATLMRFIAG